jgi:hypothetical protein
MHCLSTIRRMLGVIKRDAVMKFTPPHKAPTEGEA